MMQLYGGCIVRSCSIKAIFYKADSASESLGYICMPDYPVQGTMNITKDFLTESPINCKYKMLTSYLVSDYQIPKTVKMYRSCKAQAVRQELDYINFQCTRTSSPNVQLLARVGFVPTEAGFTNTLRFHVFITYYCSLFDRRQLDVA